MRGGAQEAEEVDGLTHVAPFGFPSLRPWHPSGTPTLQDNVTEGKCVFPLQAHLVAAFEQSLGNMTIRLQSLTMTAEQKVKQKGCFFPPCLE